MASVASQLIEEVTAHAQSDRLEDAREICADGTYFPNNLRTFVGYFTKPKKVLNCLWSNSEYTATITFSLKLKLLFVHQVYLRFL